MIADLISSRAYLLHSWILSASFISGSEYSPRIPVQCLSFVEDEYVLVHKQEETEIPSDQIPFRGA